jgi:hypothetical protein
MKKPSPTKNSNAFKESNEGSSELLQIDSISSDYKTLIPKSDGNE